MKRLLLITCSFFSLTTFSQKVFFTSPQTFDASTLNVFYASVCQQGNLVLFNAPDYRLYAFDKKSGTEKWNQYLKWKSNQAPFIVSNRIWVKMGDHVVQLDAATGEKQKDLVFASVETEPVAKNGLLYFTGIYDGGCLFAYEPQKDTIVWKRFIAHGTSQTPYYLKDKIVANVEGNRWLEFNYSGKTKDARCEVEEGQFLSESPCAKEFYALTHDGNPITGKLAKELSVDGNTIQDYVTTSRNTFLINNEQLTVLGNKLKKTVAVDLLSLSDSLVEFNTDSLSHPDESLTKILKADDTHVWIAFYHHLLIYNHAQKKLERLINLSTWEPHQIVADNNNLWIISRKDGRLYGVSI
ncbi:PQQ-binding-like beta-propeller repeat protein [Flavisolibacter tropicus]|uniref:Pyrrolo-quinoline quinone repeat domain-containing protein n=1 Tax=Flavisolibacter tropicus TaxID=1492898 RepID=A0A172TXN6_9BACT|nr:PQQ-binding-like beta-propeller repeat protein [Flavisolibacter tropicus]ANE51871.1 hypothetical protein SY85_16610 [Flavisolibacter tropicus]